MSMSPSGGGTFRERRTHFDAPKGSKVYSITARIRYTHCDIWRTVLVPEFMDLDSFHNVLQSVFEWENEHIYYFERPAKKQFFDDPRAPESMEFAKAGEKHLLASEVAVKDLLPRKGSKALYVYDMGDFWEVDLVVEDWIAFPDYGLPILPACVDGRSAPPPEDVGGPSGYEVFCEALADKGHPMHGEYAEWMWAGEDDSYDEDYFDIRYANTRFAEGMIRANPSMVPSDPDELRRDYAKLLADYFVLDTEMQLTAGMMMATLEELGADSFSELVGSPRE